MEIIENLDKYPRRFAGWNGSEGLSNYPWIENLHAPLTPLKRALPMLNLGLISLAGAYIDGTEAFDLTSRDGDTGFHEIPVEVESADLRYAAKGYDTKAVEQDRNSLIPVERLLEYQANAVIGKLNDVWWSVSSWTPNAQVVADEIAPILSERLHRYEVNAALIVPASRLGHQSAGLLARGIEMSGIPTVMIAVDKLAAERVRPPRTTYYAGEFGSIVGPADWPQFQLRVLDETLRNMETFDQPGIRRLAVELESKVEAARGER
ncbi:MAG: glycine/sarcosine/betaine reductase selenoprotein B family protein [Pyrinomonadaceae bacterium]